MSKAWLMIHCVVLSGWLGVSAHFALRTATLGNEETMLRMQMGEARAERQDLTHRRDKAQAELDRHTVPALLQSGNVRLDLGLRPTSRQLYTGLGPLARDR